MSRRSPLQEDSNTLSVALRLIDVGCITLSALVAFRWRHGVLPPPIYYQVAIILGILLTLIVFPCLGTYRMTRGKGILNQVSGLAMAWTLTCMVLVFIGFATKTSMLFSRSWLVTWMIGGFGALFGVRLLMYYTLQAMRQQGWNRRRIAIIGAGRLTQKVVQCLRDAPWLGYDIRAVFDDTKVQHHAFVHGSKDREKLSDLSKFVDDEAIDEVWIVLPLQAEQSVQTLLYTLRDSTVNIRFVPPLTSAGSLHHKVTVVAGLPVLDLHPSPLIGINRAAKAIEDFVLAPLMLLVASPMLVLIAIGVKLSSPGPILFKQRRHGWDGTPFTLIKFRTMIVHTEENGRVTQACKADDRVTGFGALLRWTSLDELPQLINVLQGHMSIVGPRPHALSHNEYYMDLIESYMQRHKVKPGITGWAQINGWRGEIDTLEQMKKRVECDFYYIDNWSLLFDLKIILLTLIKGFFHPNAY